MDGSQEIKPQRLSVAVSYCLGGKVSAQAFQSRAAGPYEEVDKERSEDDAWSGSAGSECAKGACAYDDGHPAEVCDIGSSKPDESKDIKCIQGKVSIVQEGVW